MPNSPDLSIIILTYNSQFWLKKTLTTIQEFYLEKTAFDVHVTVVDNQSTDESVEMVSKEFSWASLIQTGSNNGFAAGNNVVLKDVSSRYAMLLNSDMEFTEHTDLDVLIKYMDTHPEVGVVTPRIEFANGEIDPACHRGEPTLWASASYFSKLETLLPRTKWFGQYHQFYKDMLSIHTIDACSGAAMLVRTSAMKKVGLLDERFFMYAEDLDWCKRFREAGYQIVYHPEVRVIHHKYKSGIKSASKKIATQTGKHFYDTMLQYYDKHYHSKYPRIVRTIIRYFLAMKKEGI